MSATGVIPKGLHTSLSTLQIHETFYKKLQKAVVLNTCHIVRKFLHTEIQIPNHTFEHSTDLDNTSNQLLTY
jgi:hypothetical protein